MKKKLLIIFSAILLLLIVSVIGVVIYYNNSIDSSVSKDDTKVTFVVDKGSSSKIVIDKLYDSNLIKNKYVGYVYFKLNSDIVLQAGVYDLNRSMSFEEIIEAISSGKVVDNSISVTFIEGKRLLNYVDVISSTFGYSKDDILNKLSDEKYLKELINKYWFLTDDILNDKIYYPLEGYLSPNTYFFEKDASVETIIEKMLDTTGITLDKYKDDIENSKYSVHEMITMASIVELEGTSSSDRKGVAGVWYNRLSSGGTLGSDVTSYYGVSKPFSEELSFKDLENCNPYNTSDRNVCAFSGLPVGPIASPSVDSLVASFEPEEHDYYFFVADKYGKTYFTETYAAHVEIINKLKSEGLWYTYE